MVIASLKGRVYWASDTDADGLEDSFVAISDDFPAPYGLAVNEDSIDVLCKTSLVRLTPAKEAQVMICPTSKALSRMAGVTQPIITIGGGVRARCGGQLLHGITVPAG